MTADQVRSSQTRAEESDEVDCQLVTVVDVEGKVLKQFKWLAVEL